MTVSNDDILAATGLDKIAKGADIDNTEVEDDEVVESEEAESDVADTEAVEQSDSDDKEVEDKGEDEEDEADWIEYVVSGESKKLNLLSDADRVKVKEALEKQGLEVTAQRHAERAKAAEERLLATEIKLRELESQKEAEKPLAPYRRLIEDPSFRAQLQRTNPRLQLPVVEYSPQTVMLAAEKAENARLKQEQLRTENEKELFDITDHVKGTFGINDNQLRECISFLQEHGLGYDTEIPVRQQRDRIIHLVGIARKALIGEGRLPNPEVLKARAEADTYKGKLQAARKRRSKRAPTAGNGAVGVSSKTKQPDLTGASADELIAYYKSL